MTIPFILFALLISLVLGAFYHLIRGGDWSHLLAYLVMSTLGFAAGHFVGIWREWKFFVAGPFNLGMEIVGALLFLALTDWLLHLPQKTMENGEDR